MQSVYMEPRLARNSIGNSRYLLPGAHEIFWDFTYIWTGYCENISDGNDGLKECTCTPHNFED